VATKQPKNNNLGYGMALDRAERDALDAAGIRAQASVKHVPSKTTGKPRFVCEESGGGNKDLGHYVGFLPLAGLEPFINSQKLVTLGQNSLHRRIVATSLIRFEVFRYKENFAHVLITLHRTNSDTNQLPPRPLFRGKFGEIDKNGTVRFPSEDGSEDLTVPAELLDGFQAALVGTRCRGCQHAGHFESVANVKLREGTLAALHIVVPAAKQAASVTAESAGAKKKAKATVAA
jgi:hypothetical protein